MTTKTLTFNQIKNLLNVPSLGGNTVFSNEQDYDDRIISFKCSKNHLNIRVSTMKVLSEIRGKSTLCSECRDCSNGIEARRTSLTTAEKIAFTYITGRRSTDDFKICEYDARYIDSHLSGIQLYRNGVEIPYSFYIKKLHIGIVVSDDVDTEKRIDDICLGNESDMPIELWNIHGINISKIVYYSINGTKHVVEK
jgi:hypothetical protein